MSQALEMRALASFGLPRRNEFASCAPPIVVAKRVEPSDASDLAEVEFVALDLSALGQTRKPRRALGWGAASSIALHGGFVLAALLWSQSRTERAPEPMAVEIVVERAPDPAPAVETPAPVAETQAPTPVAVEPPSPVAESPPEPMPSPEAVAAPTPTPTPVAADTPPPVAETPPTQTPEPTPSPEAVPAPTPTPVAVETPAKPTPTPEAIPRPPPAAKAEPPKPAPAPKKIDRAPATVAKPKPATKPAAPRDAVASPSGQFRATAPASRASVGEYRDAVYARLRARQHFPEAARESGAHGTAELTFSIDDAGQLRSVSLLKSAGDADLDADALATVRRSAPFAPPPPGAPREFPVKLHYALQ